MTRALGIDFGHHSVKIAELELGTKGKQIIGLYEVKPREGQDAADALREFFGQSQIKAEKISIGLNDSSTLVKRFDFPFRDKKRVKLAVDGEWMDIVPFDLDEYSTDTRAAGKHGRLNSFVSGLVPTSRIETLNLITESAWVQPNAVLFDAEALGLLALQQNLPDSQVVESYAVCDFGYNLTKIAILRGSGPAGLRRTPQSIGFEPEMLELRHIDKGTREWIQWIADKRNVSTDEALQWLVHRAEIQTSTPGEESIRDDLSDDIKSALRPVVVELYQTLQACKVRSGHNAEILYITGSMSRIQGLKDFLEAELRVRVEFWPLFLGFDAHDAVLSPSNQKSFATALALANAFTIKHSQPWLNFRRTTSPHKKLLSETFQKLIGPELKPAFALLGVSLAFMWIYGAFGSYMASIQRQAIQKDLVGEFRRLDSGMGERANRFVEDPVRAREIFVDLRDKKAPTLSSETQDLGPRTQVAILEDFSNAIPGAIKVLQLDVQYNEADTSVQAIITSAKDEDRAQFSESSDAYIALLTRAGYSNIQKLPQDTSLRIDAKLLPKARAQGVAR